MSILLLLYELGVFSFCMVVGNKIFFFFFAQVRRGQGVFFAGEFIGKVGATLDICIYDRI
jgi:hypothetical protein